MKKRLSLFGMLGAIAYLLVSVSIIHAAEEQKNGPVKENPVKEADRRAYLGVAVESLPAIMAGQMPDLKGRGVLVAHVAQDSPAQKAGLKTEDILIAYGDHQLYAPEQLVKLIQNDKPGGEATLEVLSAGKRETIKVKLGDRPTSAAELAHERRFRFERRAGPIIRSFEFEQRANADNETSWARFDSMTLSALGDKRFKAEINYRDDQGKRQHKEFQGSRQEIRDSVNQEKDLPAIERDKLLRGLDLKPVILETPGPGPQSSDKPQGGALEF